MADVSSILYFLLSKLMVGMTFDVAMNYYCNKLNPWLRTTYVNKIHTYKYAHILYEWLFKDTESLLVIILEIYQIHRFLNKNKEYTHSCRKL